MSICQLYLVNYNGLWGTETKQLNRQLSWTISAKQLKQLSNINQTFIAFDDRGVMRHGEKQHWDKHAFFFNTAQNYDLIINESPKVTCNLEIVGRPAGFPFSIPEEISCPFSKAIFLWSDFLENRNGESISDKGKKPLIWETCNVSRTWWEINRFYMYMYKPLKKHF